ncbi:3-hydroxyacyl-CoA dehydrogenase family protein [Desulfofundulus thermocisternus]|uniref:3-hydroxyacyl-CoA dehydrogenase family protein n=1 Tax=Desulfofundulus thermocisternus TaxID=42471 RepID=UPI0004897820|nr:3-hydroxyacyl-CoA dehydrogenase family protein [Desulfofundulus thermocisternus]
MVGIKKVACLGAGTIGSSWAAYFLIKGLQVNVQDVNEEIIGNARKKINTILQSLVDKEIISERDRADAISRVFFTTSIAEAVKDVQFIQESAVERYEVKQKIINEVDSCAPESVIFASSSSGLLVSRLQECSSYPGRIVIGHPFNPPHLIPLVEIVRGNADKNTVRLASDFYREIGKVPIILNKEVPGHVANRIQAAVWRECIDLVMKEVCSVKDVDAAVCYGPGLRWALLGPTMIFHLGGGDKGLKGFLEHLGEAFESWWSDMAAWSKFPKGSKEALLVGLQEELENKNIDEIVQWRDDRLVAMLKLLNLL